MLFPSAADVSWLNSPARLRYCVLSLMFVVRPIGVGVATIGLPFNLSNAVSLVGLARHSQPRSLRFVLSWPGSWERDAFRGWCF